jgi:hypothetical protein
VYASAAGYIAHIGIRPESFGRYIIINHPNGYSTLYAHLNDFFPALENYVTDQQYKKESWTIELNFDKNQFPVTKGEFIAYSGTTGGSQGPHLHFEIRTTKTDECINPLFFNLPIKDEVAPDIIRLAVYDRTYSTYDQSPQLFLLKKTDSGYIIPKTPVLKTGLKKISFAVQTTDRVSGSSNPNGIYAASLFLDEQPQVAFSLDSLSYAESVNVNAQVDYKYKVESGLFLQHLSKLPGNDSHVYKKINGDGIIELADTSIHSIAIKIKDAYQNESILNFAIQYSDSLATIERYASSLPLFLPGNANIFEKPGFELYMPEDCLYDSIHVFYSVNNTLPLYALSAAYQVNDASIPLHNNITVRIKPEQKVPDGLNDKIIIQRSSRGRSIRKAQGQKEGWLTAQFDDLGTFQAFIDTIPPAINGIDDGADTLDFSPQKNIIIKPTDNFGAIHYFRAELDSQWIRFTNDKGTYFTYNFDERCPFGVHQLKVSVEDLVGNSTTKTWWFKRYPYTPPPKKKAIRKTKNKKSVSTHEPPVKKKK